MKINQEEIPKKILDSNIAIIGYGPIARAIALCLRDSGLKVSIGLRNGSQNIQNAKDDGFSVATIKEAVSIADAVFLLIPDDVQGDVFKEHISQSMRKGSILVLAHGYSFLYEKIELPDGIDGVVIAPHGPGKALRELYLSGSGLACEIAIYQDSTGNASNRAIALARSLGFDKGGLRITSVADEVIMDQFSEQMVLCGGVVELMRAAYRTLIDAGYDPESAYESVVRELKYTIDIMHDYGPEGLFLIISKSALIGSILNGKMAVGDDVMKRMKSVLDEIRAGEFEKKFRSYAERLPDLEHFIEQLKRDFEH